MALASRCSRNVRIVPDYPSLASLATSGDSSARNADILVIPGGAPGAKTMSTDPESLALIGKFRSEDKWVGCICAGTTALVAATAVDGPKVTVTSHPSVANEIKEKGWSYSEDRVVVDGKIITSRG